MARALRRTTLTPQIQEERCICGTSSSSSKKSGINNMLLNGGGGGSVVLPVEKAYEHNSNGHTQQNYVSSSSPCLIGGMAGPTAFSSPPPPSSASHSDNLFSLANLSVIFPLSCLRLMGRTGGSTERPPKSSRSAFLKRPMLHLLLCLVFGIIIGFSSIRWPDFSSSARNDVPHDLATLNGFVTKLRREGSQTVSRGENLATYDSWRVSTGVGKIADVTSGADNSRAFQIKQPGSGVLELAPGLNYSFDPQRKLLIIVTPTYNRAFQAHYLTRLAHTLRLVPPPLLWLVVEMPFQTLETALFLRQTGITYRHLVCRDNVTNIKHRGIHQRNFALEHIEMHQLNGIVYFADDDNVYSQDLFEQMGKIRRFGTWPVGMLAEGKEKVILEGPVCDGEKVIGWHTDEKSKKMRRFHVDMSGFAFNSTMLWDTTNWRHRSTEPIRQLAVKEGLQETAFIEQLVEDEDQMQGLPNGCSQIMVWNLNMEAPELAYPYGWSLARPLFPNIPLQNRT